MYRASGALFSTMETVAGEKPVALATSRMVTSPRLFRAFIRRLARLSSGDKPGNSKSKRVPLAPKPVRQRRELCLHGLQGWRSELEVLLFRRDFERHFLAEPGGLPHPIGHAQCQPDCARNFRRRT